MDFPRRITSCLLFFCVAFIAEVLCSGASFSPNNPSNVTSNAWPQLGSQNPHYVNPSWAHSGQTTPWSELGPRRRNQNVPPVQNAPTWVQSGPTWVQSGSTWVRATTTPRTNFENVPPPSGTRIPHDSAGRQQQNESDVQDDELRNFSENLLQRDTNNAARFVAINYQGKTTSRSQNDEAPQPYEFVRKKGKDIKRFLLCNLVEYIKAPLLSIHSDAYNIPTIAKLMFLHDNYILETNQNEHVSPQEREEENNLLDALVATPVMQLTRNFLIDKGKIGRDPNEFRDVLKEIWFNMYSRGGGKIGSSGFEHVFLAEIKNGAVSGLHNWLFFKEEEARNRANYLGYMKKIELGDKGAILKHHFKFRDVDKPVGSMFIGTSPELEIALYTTCFLLRADRVCPLRLAGNNFVIRTYTYRHRGKSLIGSAFPEI